MCLTQLSTKPRPTNGDGEPLVGAGSRSHKSAKVEQKQRLLSSRNYVHNTCTHLRQSFSSIHPPSLLKR